MRVVIDTNLWISFLIGKQVMVMKSALERKDVELIITDKLIQEIEIVVNYPKLRKFIRPELAEEMVTWLKTHSTNVCIDNVPSRCRDPKDDYLLELAIRSNAVYLVSGDSDLLTLKRIDNCRIITFRQFLSELGIA